MSSQVSVASRASQSSLEQAQRIDSNFGRPRTPIWSLVIEEEELIGVFAVGFSPTNQASRCCTRVDILGGVSSKESFSRMSAIRVRGVKYIRPLRGGRVFLGSLLDYTLAFAFLIGCD